MLGGGKVKRGGKSEGGRDEKRERGGGGVEGYFRGEEGEGEGGKGWGARRVDRGGGIMGKEGVVNG